MLKVDVHPNPVTGNEFRLDIHDFDIGACQLSLYDSSGKVVFRRKYEVEPNAGECSLQIHIPEIHPGIYLLHILSDKSSAVEKLIIK
jgi:hypothetical protein